MMMSSFTLGCHWDLLACLLFLMEICYAVMYTIIHYKTKNVKCDRM